MLRVIVNVSRWIMNLGFRIAEQCEKEHKRKKYRYNSLVFEMRTKIIAM